MKSLFGYFSKKIKSRKILVAAIITTTVLFFIAKALLTPVSNKSDSTTVKRTYIKQQLTLSGQIDAEEHATLQFQTGGKLAWLGVKNGDRVKKGQMLAYLEKEKLEAVLRQARQDFIAAQAPHDKYYDGRTGESESYDQKVTRTALDATQNKAYDNVRIAQENLKDATLYSPIEGIVVRIDPIFPGTNIYVPSQAQIEITNPNTLYLNVTADQTDVVGLRGGQSGEFILDSYPDRKIKGTIKSISFSPKKDETGTVYEVKVNLDGQNLQTPPNASQKEDYRLGMTGDITFTTKTKSNVLYLPSKFIKSDDKGNYVNLGRERKKTYVTTGLETDNDTEIISGLSEGNLVYD